MTRLNTHSNIDNFGFGGSRAEADIHDTKVNKTAYMKASLAARKYAKQKGISPVKTTKALSEATRSHVDYNYGRGSAAQSDITRGLNGLTSRLSTGNRGGRVAKGGNYLTSKGSMVDTFGKYLANETVGGRTPVFRPKTPKGTVVKGAVKAAEKFTKLF